MLLALTGAGRTRVALLTTLPVVWGEGDVADVLAGRTGRSALLAVLDLSFDVRAIDTLSRATLRRDILILAQPRRLTASELVVFDRWVRGGGRAIIFADPELVWPSRLALADRRRPPPVTLLDPLFAHWGVALGDSTRRREAVMLNGNAVTFTASGTWTAPRSCTGQGTVVLECAIGRGRATLVGDADVLDARGDEATETAAWITTVADALQHNK